MNPGLDSGFLRRTLNRWRYRKNWPATAHDPEEDAIDYILRSPPGEQRPPRLRGKPWK